MVDLFKALCNSSREIPKALATGEVVDMLPYFYFHFWKKYLSPWTQGEKKNLLAGLTHPRTLVTYSHIGHC
jgi:hypothetical protein